jgi:nucleotide-binding universal stress UspA family protein
MNILVVLDGNAGTLDEAVRLTRERGASLTGLFVREAGWNDYLGHDWLSGSNARSGFLDYVADRERELEKAVTASFPERATGLPASLKIAAGRVAEEIVAEARRGYDLIVCSNPLTRGLEIVRDGAAVLARDAPCSLHFVHAAG